MKFSITSELEGSKLKKSLLNIHFQQIEMKLNTLCYFQIKNVAHKIIENFQIFYGN